MRLESARWHNMGPFADWSLDLYGIDPAAKIVALTGINGKGKSFCLESAVAGACYRKMPTQGTVAKRATARDSWQESTIVHAGQRYRITHLYDAVGGKGETLVVDDHGPVLSDTKVSAFEAWSAKHLPDPDVLFASLFAAQQSEGFVQMSSGDRIGIILRVIGVARYERMAAAARKRRDELSEKLDQVVKRIADIRGGCTTVEQSEAQLAAARETIAGFERSVEERKAALADAKEADAAARVTIAQREAAVRELAELRRQLDDVGAKRKPIAERVVNNRAVLLEGDAIRTAVATTERLKAELPTVEAEVVAAKAAADAAMAPWLDVNERIAAAAGRAERAAGRVRDAAAVQAAKAALPDLLDEALEADAKKTDLEAQLEELQSTHLAGADEREKALLQVIETGATMADEEAGYDDIAGVLREGLSANEESVATVAAVPARARELKERLAAARDRLAVAKRQVEDAERLAARGADVDSAGVEKAEAEAEVRRLREGYAQAGEDAKAKAAAYSGLVQRAQALRERIAAEATLAGKAVPLANAETRLAELEPQLVAFDADVARLEGVIAALPSLPEAPPRPDLVVLEGKLERAESLLQFERDGLVRLEQALEFARATDAKVAELEQERAAVETQLGVNTRLALDLGRSGLQSAEVDSAGPELTELVNDLLRTCHGPRFTVSVDTQRLTSDGKKTVDECLISVIDTEKGTEKEVREHSGGERVILGEAISLALTMLACRRAGFERPTLFRDESAAALDPANARAWVAMMRRAVELTGADRLLFVSHSPEVVEMADAQIPVGEPAASAARAA